MQILKYQDFLIFQINPMQWHQQPPLHAHVAAVQLQIQTIQIQVWLKLKFLPSWWPPPSSVSASRRSSSLAWSSSCSSTPSSHSSTTGRRTTEISRAAVSSIGWLTIIQVRIEKKSVKHTFGLDTPSKYLPPQVNKNWIV